MEGRDVVTSFFRVNSELSKEEFLTCLDRECTAEQVRELRLMLFDESVEKKLADGGDVLVMRNKVSSEAL